MRTLIYRLKKFFCISLEENIDEAQGDHVRWFGVTDTLATEESGNVENNKIFGGVSFNHFSKTNAATSSAGSWNAVRVNACIPYNGGLDEEGKDPSGANISK